MKKIFFGLLCLSILLISCQNHNGIRIRGMIEGANGRTLHLAILGNDGLTTIDSTVIRNGDFDFRISKKLCQEIMPGEESLFFNLSFSEDNSMTTLAGMGECVELRLTNPDRIVEAYQATGAADAVLMRQLDSALSVFASHTDTLLHLYQIHQNSDSIRADIENHYNSLVEDHRQYLRNFILQHPKSLSSIIAFYRVYNHHRFLDDDTDADIFRLMTDSLSAKYPQSQYVEYLKTRR